MKILSLYAGIGGNRKLWGNEHIITAIENNKETADTYSNLFPNDIVIIADAHKYLLEHFNEFDFIWSSPPCPTHSRINHARVRKPDFPDMKLYEEIIFLKQNFNGFFVVENVIPYYDYLIKPTIIIERHPFWCNFRILPFEPKEKAYIRMKGGTVNFERIYGFDISESKIKDKRKALRNCVHPEIGNHILNCAIGIFNAENQHKTPIQTTLKL